MLFNSLQYAYFLPLTLLVYWLAPKNWRVDVLLIASYVFYATWSIPYAAMMFFLAVTNYLFGRALGRATQHRKLLLWIFIGLDLSVLAVFKYWNFALDSSAFLVHSTTGSTWQPPFLELVLPLGISFFTFEFIHYLVDIYHGDVPVHSFSRFHVFAAFFPTQIAGPIKRFQQFVPALTESHRFDPELAKDGLRLIAIGLVKKVLLADKLAPIADVGFTAASTGRLGTVDAWVATLAFSLQIFFDFSGYTDIARGSAQLFGFHIPINFNAPYLATSVSDFWRRWHISLSTWLRDYLFIPLGGSRATVARTVRNLLITMTLGGLWHGAAWHFVVWGIYWGAVLGLDRLLRPRLPLKGTLEASLAGWIVTQFVVLVGWVLFRAQDLPQAGAMLQPMLTYVPYGGALSPGTGVYVVAVAAGLVVVSLLGRVRWPVALPSPFRPAFVGVAIALAIAYAAVAEPPAEQRFVYFQF